MTAALIVIASFVVVGGVVWLTNYLQRRNRAAAPTVRAAAVGGRRVPDDFASEDLPFGSFQDGGIRKRLELVAQVASPYGGRQWTFRVAASSFHSQNELWYSCTLVEVPEVWPHVGLERRDNDAPMGIPNEPEAAFPQQRAFNKTYLVRGSDPLFATTFFSDEARQWLLEHGGVVFLEVNAGFLLVAFEGRLEDDLLSRLMTWSQRLLDATPLDIWPGEQRRLP